MALLRNLNQFLGALLDTLRSLLRGKIWGVLLLNFLLAALLLYAHFDFLSPIFYGLVRGSSTLVAAVTSSDVDLFYHYPSHFVLLPWFFGWVKLLLSLVFEVLCVGMAAVLFYRLYTRATDPEPKLFARVSSVWPQLFLVALVMNALVITFSLLLPGMMEDFLEGSPRRQALMEFGILPFVYTLIMAVFFLSIPLVAIYRQPFHTAIARSARFFIHRPFTAFFSALIAFVLPIILSAIANHSNAIIDKFKPELVFWVLLVGLVGDVIANFIWMGTSVRYIVDEE